MVSVGSPPGDRCFRIRRTLTAYGQPSVLSHELLTAYRATHYIVDDEPPFVLQVDQHSESLADWQRRQGVVRSVFITACNPYSDCLDPSDNLRRQKALAQDIARLGLVACQGRGEATDGDWPSEPSLLVAGLSRDDALALAARYAQNAILDCSLDAIPRLLLLR